MFRYEFQYYILDGREHFVYGDRDGTMLRENYLFPQSLLLLLDLNVVEIDTITHRLDRLIERYQAERTEEIEKEIMSGLEELAAMHIFFTLLPLDWRWRFDRARDADWRTMSDLLPRKRISHLYVEVQERQRQIKTLFHEILSSELDRAGTPQRMAAYYQKEIKFEQDRYHFRPHPVCYELVEQGNFTDVLHPDDVYDLIDYSVTECVKRQLRMKVCERCGRWFAMSRNTAEYCNLPVDGKRGRSCREVAAMEKWTESRKDDTIFKEYRREYKRRFAWIRAGRITAEEFYQWSEQARLREADCEKGGTSFEEFKNWLKYSN